jgi:hypothetical protein
VHEQPAHGLLHQVQHFLEAVGATVVGIGDVRGRALGRELEQQSQPLMGAAGRAPPQHAQVLPVHRQNQIETLEICRLYHPRAQRRQIVATARGRLAGAGIRRLADVVARGTGGVHLHREFGCFARGHDAQHAFSSGRAADVAQTHK